MRGYSADSGTGEHLDESANDPLGRDQVTDMNNARGGWRFGIFSYGTYNLAVYSTGFRDGFFGTYIGFDATGKKCRLLTDFGLVNWKN